LPDLQTLGQEDETYQNDRGANMITIVALWLLASAANVPSVQDTKVADSSVTHPAFVAMPKSPNGLTLYNEKGYVVARCETKEETFRDCKMEPGVTFDDLMNAWVHAYLEVQK
jgi:hypothetical protein